MELLEGIYSRRSIRKYRPGNIPYETMEKLLKAAMAAPSANNCQPWHFIVIDNRDIFHEITKIHPYAQMLTYAGAAILILGDSELDNGSGYWTADCGAATQNILLAAHGLGLGAVWIGIYPRESRMDAFKKLFTIPENIHPYALISLGFPGEKKPPSERYRPERIRFNTWH